MQPDADEHGQASVELLAAIPILVGALLLVAQLAVAGYALWAAGDAARAGARAAHIGDEADAAALKKLPLWFEPEAEIETDEAGEAVHVQVQAPALFPGVPSIPIEAGAALDPLAGG